MKRFTQGKVTLAIGDGANDVNMIQSADLGFGLMGKEGNQAAAFADYAIPRYKDLRRALFWHGRGYGWRIQYFTIIVIAKSIINAIAKYGVQFTNGGSGNQPVDDILIIGFNIFMTNYFILTYSIYDQEVSFKDYGTIEKEQGLPFRMSDLYAFTRRFINRKRFLKLIFINNFYCIWCGLVIWMVWHFCEKGYIIDSIGEIPGLYTYGVFITLCVVITHHLWVAVNVRNWTWWSFGWLLFSIMWLPIILYVSSLFGKMTQNLKAVYSHILGNPQIWLMTLVTCFVIMCPIYINKKYLQVIKYPQFYKV